MEISMLQSSPLDGFVLPGKPGNTAFKLHMYVMQQSAARAIDALEQYSSLAAPVKKKLIDSTLEYIFSLSEIDRISAFHSPLLFYTIKKINFSKLTDNDEASVLLTGSLFRSAQGSALFMIPGDLIPGDGLPFPHLDLLLLKTTLTIAIEKTTDLVRFTWSDGTVLTMTIGMHHSQPFFSDKYTITPQLGPFQYLNYLTRLQTLRLPEVANGYSAQESSALANGFMLLSDIWPEAACNVHFIFKGIYLLYYNGRYTSSLTNHEIPNAFIASITDHYQTGDAMVHEVSHSRLNDLLQYDPLLKGNDEPVHKSPWRQDLRPLSGILNGVHAFLNVFHYYKKLISGNHPASAADSFNNILETQYENLMKGWNYLTTQADPTKMGEIILEQIDVEIKKI